MRNKLKPFLYLAVNLFVAFESLSQTSTFSLGDGVRGPMNTGGSISVFLNNTRPVVGVQFTLVNEPALLSVTAVSTGERTNAIFDVVDFNNLSGDTTKILAMNTDASSQLDAGAGEILQIDFDLQAGAAAGTIPLDFAELFLVDANGQLIPTVGKRGTFFDPAVTDFREVSKAVGFEQLFNFPGPGAFGSAWGDYDLDGDEDLLYIGYRPTLLRNNGDGTFTEVGEASGLSTGTSEIATRDVALSAAWGDYDNDGDPDAFILAQFGRRVLLENNGDGIFTDATAVAGLVVQSQGAFSANWVDFNNDGHLDLYTSDGFLFQNNGDQTFRDVSNETGIGSAPFAGTAWADYDNDGDMDLMTHDRQFRNDNGAFADVTAATGIISGSSFPGGMAWGDYDNDGFLDLYMTRGEFMPSNLYKNNGNGTFTDVTLAAGVGLEKANAVAWADVDNDADLDLFVTRPAVIDSPYVLFRNNGDGTFTDIAPLARMVRGAWFPGHPGAQPGQGAAWGDFNNDGKLDLFVANNSPPDFLFENHGNGTGNHFLALKLVGTNSNKSAIGARVTVEAGGVTQIREVEGGANTSQNSLPVEFGLGQAQQVDNITIRWPSGLQESTTRTVAADQFLTLEEGTLHTVDVAEDPHSIFPAEFSLLQNYPNPFNPTTTLQYQLPKAERVTLKIYNLVGQEVQTLVDEIKQPGIYSVVWDGKNRRGLEVGTGLYVARMVAGEFVRSQKIVFLK